MCLWSPSPDINRGDINSTSTNKDKKKVEYFFLLVLYRVAFWLRVQKLMNNFKLVFLIG